MCKLIKLHEKSYQEYHQNSQEQDLNMKIKMVLLEGLVQKSLSQHEELGEQKSNIYISIGIDQNKL